ncbi:hypothetical protein Q6940_002072 [Vibrio cholerae]
MLFLDDLIDLVEELDLESSLDLAAVIGGFLFYNEAPVFDLSRVESYLTEKCLEEIDFKVNSLSSKSNALFVVTEPYMTGGHTRLMENLGLMLDTKSDLLITRSSCNSVKQRLEKIFNEIIEIYRNSTKNNSNHIIELANEISKYENVILNIHPDDIFTVIACAVAKSFNKNIKVFFVNHADHVFSYGATVADFWFEISLYGRSLDKLRNLKGNKSFIGIPINKPEADFFRNIKYPTLDKIFNCTTAGSDNKYKPSNGHSIIPLVNKILESNTSVTVHVIGASLITNYWWWWSKIKFFNKLEIDKSLPYLDYIEVTKNADLYIDSHPMPGGTAFVEQFIQGNPCVGLKSGFFGYTPLEIIKKDNVEQVFDLLLNPPAMDEINKIQKLNFEVHGFSQVKKRFRDVIYNGEVHSNPMSDFIASNEQRCFNYKKLIVSKDLFKLIYKHDKKKFIILFLRASIKSKLKLIISILLRRETT